MAEGARTPRGKAPASEPQELLLDEPLATPPAAPSGFEALVTALGGGTLDFPAMLAIADILPVMVGYVDTSFVYRFVNKPFADWFERPRRDILGRHMSELIGGDSAAVVAHPNEAGATALHVDLDAPRAGIQTVLDELLDDGGGPLDHLAGGDLIDELAGKNADGHGDSRTPRAVRQGPQPARQCRSLPI